MSTQNRSANWRKAKASGLSNCVEVRALDGRVDIRDSKHPHAQHLSLAPAVFRTWVDSLKGADTRR